MERTRAYRVQMRKGEQTHRKLHVDLDGLADRLPKNVAYSIERTGSCLLHWKVHKPKTKQWNTTKQRNNNNNHE
eukprot:scaffold6052_cov118-Cylindrotheca_fusiformis.AAC.18